VKKKGSQPQKYFNVVGEDFAIDHHVTYSTIKINPHTHDFIELIYIVSAKGSYYAEGMEYRLKERDLIVTPPATHHRIDFHSTIPYERYRMSINPKLISDIDVKSVLKNIQVINCADQRTISDIFKKFDYYYMAFNEEDFKNISRMLIKEIFYNLTLFDSESTVEPSFLSPILSKALDYINKNLFEIESVSEVSKSLYITDSYLFEIFKTQLKTSPKKYINLKRLHAAQKEIMLGAKPTEIYQKVGFKDYTSFNRNYNKFFGHPPSQEKYFIFSNDHLYY